MILLQNYKNFVFIETRNPQRGASIPGPLTGARQSNDDSITRTVLSSHIA